MDARKKLQNAIDRVQQRLRVQLLLDSLFLSAIPAAILLLVSMLLERVETLPSLSLGLLIAAIVVQLGGVLYGLFWPLKEHMTTWQIDSRMELQDRIAAALEYIDRDEQTPFAKAAIADALKHADRVDPKTVAPFSWPVGLRELAMTALAFAVLPFV